MNLLDRRSSRQIYYGLANAAIGDMIITTSTGSLSEWTKHYNVQVRHYKRLIPGY